MIDIICSNHYECSCCPIKKKCDEIEKSSSANLWEIYQQGSTDGESSGITRVLDILESLDKQILEKVKDKLYDQDYTELKNQKICSNGEPCIHPGCKRCGTAHFISDCDYNEQKEKR